MKNNGKICKKISFFLILFFLAFYFTGVLIDKAVAAQGAVNISATVPGCGDGAIGSGEQCDGNQLGGQTCSSRGYSSGILSCNSNCVFDVSNCTSGGGGGGGSVYIPPPQTTVNFSGKAYPKSAVTLLKDAQVAATIVAGVDAGFQTSITGLAAGNYIFSLYSEDKEGRRSSLLTFPVGVTQGVTTYVSGIFIAPTIAVDKNEVKRGDNIAIFGQSAPAADIVISVNSKEEIFTKTAADKDGIYLYNFDTSVLDYGAHVTKSKAAISGQMISGFSSAVSFKVGDKTVAKASPAKCGKADLNCDNRVNLVDFSITAYWYKRSSPPTSIDFNGDGKIDLVDFSIMAYYWTG